MKKIGRLTAFVLVLVMCFSVTAFAANTKTENDLATITGIASGATVEFASLNDGEEKINVTYTNTTAIEDGGYYLVMVIDAEKGGANYTPNKDSILYIDQTTGDAEGSISFQVYPSDLTDSAIVIYGMDNKLIAAIIEKNGITYLLGDVNSDGFVTSRDAMLIAQNIVGIPIAGTYNEAAANVNADTGVTSRDAMLIAQWIVGIPVEYLIGQPIG